MVAAILGAALAGCAQPATPDLTGEGWSRERFEGTAEGAVFEAARDALSQWFRIADARPVAGRITTEPLERDERGGTGRIRDEVLNFRNRVRRIATMRVVKTADAVVAECRVQKERLDTADLRLFAQQRAADEAPTGATAHNELSARADQVETWTDIGRDRAMERQILDATRGRLSPAGAKPEPQ